jgi:AcrR family transcriptional regulator
VITPAQKAKRSQKVAEAVRRSEYWREQRDNAIRLAREEGMTLREIAKAANLSPEWVRRIAETSRSPSP